jgi:hypothetical protein
MIRCLGGVDDCGCGGEGESKCKGVVANVDANVDADVDGGDETLS